MRKTQKGKSLHGRRVPGVSTDAHDTRELTLGEGETIVINNAHIHYQVVEELRTLQGYDGLGAQLIDGLRSVCSSLVYRAKNKDAWYDAQDAIEHLDTLLDVEYSLGLLCKVENYSVGKEMCDEPE